MTKLTGYEFDNLQTGMLFCAYDGRARKVLEVGRVSHGNNGLLRQVTISKDGQNVSITVKRL